MVQWRRIGLTGGIATGKSTVAHLLSEHHGIPVLDADQFAKEALAPGTAATLMVLRRYGQAVCALGHEDEPPTVNRKALASIVFANPSERRWLEELIHPIVKACLVSHLQRLRDKPIVALMIPLLFEAGLEQLCTEIWVVDCGSESEQIRRLQARDGLTPGEAKQRIASQWPMATKLKRADVEIHNIGSLPALLGQVTAALNQHDKTGRTGEPSWLSD